ncbi:MAG: 23S rRNA (uracil(1939)-C(5))-methyltransferase RlmD, partial [Clostridia bacterium]|nr:23S rRNA (uracil(1939)-C(5))-methyltransferase RlmD [Clostridia bacterium]
KVSGDVIFLQNGVAGEKVKIKIIKCAKNYYIARIEEILSSSNHRIEPKCPHYRRCGGCSFQHISYDHEKDLKKSFVKDCFRKEGLQNVEILPTLSTNEISGYRNKGQFPLTLSDDGKVVSGFFASKSHKVCPIENCDIQDSSFSEITKFLCDYFTKKNILPYDEENHSGLVRHIYLRRAKGTGEIMLCLILKVDSFPREEEFALLVTKQFPEIKSISFNIQGEKNNVILGKKIRTVWGKDKIVDFLCEKKLLISPMSFYQVNHDAAELLYRTALKWQMFQILILS